MRVKLPYLPKAPITPSTMAPDAIAIRHDGLPDDNRATSIMAVNGAGIVLAITATILRCFVRIRLIKAFGVDDWLMAGAAVRHTRRVPKTHSLTSLGVICLLHLLLHEGRPLRDGSTPLESHTRERGACQDGE